MERPELSLRALEKEEATKNICAQVLRKDRRKKKESDRKRENGKIKEDQK